MRQLLCAIISRPNINLLSSTIHRTAKYLTVCIHIHSSRHFNDYIVYFVRPIKAYKNGSEHR